MGKAGRFAYIHRQLSLRLELYTLDVVERRPSIVVPLESKTSAGAFPSADEVPSCSLAHLESPSVAGMKGPREQRGQRVTRGVICCVRLIVTGPRLKEAVGSILPALGREIIHYQSVPRVPVDDSVYCQSD